MSRRSSMTQSMWSLEQKDPECASSLIECVNVNFAYHKELVLKDVSFEVKSRDFLAVIGPNGGGKSTLMKLLLGLLKPQSGSIIYQKDWHHRIGYVPQDTGENRDFPIQVMDVVKMGFLKPRWFGFHTSALQDKRMYEILNRLGIAHLTKRKMSELSGGQRQRVLLARALCGDPEILMLDEPTSSVDSKAQKEIYNLLKFFNNFHTIIVISHDISILLGYASKVLSVNKEVVLHDVPKLEISQQGHICEIDILNQILEERHEKRI